MSDNEMQRIFETLHRHPTSFGPSQGLLALATIVLVRRSQNLQPEAIRFYYTAISTITGVDIAQSVPLSNDVLLTISLLNIFDVSSFVAIACAARQWGQKLTTGPAIRSSLDNATATPFQGVDSGIAVLKV